MSKKTVVIVGVLDKQGSTNISQAKAFLRLGYDVIPINYRTIIQKYGMKKFESMILDVVRGYRPHMIMFCKCNGINSSIIEKCNKHTKTWLWNPDVIYEGEWNRYPEVIEHAKVANFSSCTGGGIAEFFRNKGVENCYHIFDGVDIDVFKPVDFHTQYNATVSFIGNQTKNRDEVKKLLETYIPNTKFYGMGYNTEIIQKEFSKVCSSSLIMLSLNNDGCENMPEYASNRLLRYLGCGSCVLHYDTTGTLTKYFEHNKEIIYFSNAQELIDSITMLLGNPEIAGNIAIRGREKVLKEYTWEHTISNILSIVENKAVI